MSGVYGNVDVSKFRQANNPVSLAPIEETFSSNVQSRLSGGTADILPAERAKATFNVEKMTNLLDGGEETTERRRFITSVTEDFNTFNKYFWERPEALKQHVKFFLDAHDEHLGKIIPSFQDGSFMSDNAMLSGSFVNHYGLFLPTLAGQASGEQQSQWIPQTITFQMVGVYCQTELGHGSNVRGLNTVATYDKNSQEFILETPTLQSIKWWISGLGKVATHALVYAQLILDGKEYGVHIFLVQLRDENHRPIPGIQIGDVGPKLGDHCNDTGFLRLDKVRIPREHMLARWQHVTPEGEYVKSERKTNPRVHYATMVYTRGSMIRTSGGHLARAVTIAIRYSCVRHQGFVQSKGTPSYQAPERQVIDYRMQQKRLFKQLATSYAIKFIGGWMLTKFKDMDGYGLENLDALPEIASTAAGLKGLCTFLAAEGIEDCRKCCGGHGYLLASGVAAIGADFVWQTTAEGDFIVMMLQCARFLIKEYEKAKKGHKTSGPCSYMNILGDSNVNVLNCGPPPARSVEDFYHPENIVQIYAYRALVSISFVAEEFGSLVHSKGLSFDDAWNECAVELVNAVRAHCLYFMLRTFSDQVNQLEDAACGDALRNLCCLFGLTYIIDDQWDGLVQHDQLVLMRGASRNIIDRIRPNAVALVDAFEIPDRVLQSAIGRYDGNVYEALFESALKSSLNQSDPFDGIENLRKYLNTEDLKNPNKLQASL